LAFPLESVNFESLNDIHGSMTALPWEAMSPDLNPIEHAWDFLGRRVQAFEPLGKHNNYQQK
jgi:hypothetical protein